MNLPFSTEDFFAVFRNYNEAIYPMQWALYFLAAAILALMLIKDSRAGRLIASILSFLWLWMAIAYHWISFSPINPAARGFAVIFFLQAALLVFVGIKNRLAFDRTKGWNLYTGYALIILGTIVYPIVGYLLGHRFPSSPTFGLPCPTTIFTLGVLIAAKDCPKYLVVIPFIWSLIGFSAAISLGVREDVLLLISGFAGLAMIVFRKKRPVPISM